MLTLSDLPADISHYIVRMVDSNKFITALDLDDWKCVLNSGFYSKSKTWWDLKVVNEIVVATRPTTVKWIVGRYIDVCKQKALDVPMSFSVITILGNNVLDETTIQNLDVLNWVEESKLLETKI